MGAILRQLWISRDCRKLVSQKLQRRLVVISMVLGASVFLVFLGALMWALIAASRDPSVNLSALKYVSYAFFGIGGAGVLAFCLLWLIYVRDAKYEIRQQELRHAPDLFRFPEPPEPPQEPQPSAAVGAVTEQDPATQLTDLHSAYGSRPDLVEFPSQRPGVVSSPPAWSVRHPSNSSTVYDPSTPSCASDRPLTLTAASVGRPQLSRHPLDQPPRPRAVSHSDLASAVILEPSALAVSRPSSVTTSSSRDRFIA